MSADSNFPTRFAIKFAEAIEVDVSRLRSGFEFDSGDEDAIFMAGSS